MGPSVLVVCSDGVCGGVDGVCGGGGGVKQDQNEPKRGKRIF